MPTIIMPLMGEVQVLALANIRQGAPYRSAPLLRKALAGTRLLVAGVINGEPVDGNPHWFSLTDGNFIWSGACGPLQGIDAALAATLVPPATVAAAEPDLSKYGFDPVFAGKLSTLLQACAEAGLEFRVASGLRTPQTQADYYCGWAKRSPADIDAAAAELAAAGAPWIAGLLTARRDMKRQPDWQTDARPGEGWHQWGEAADCYCYRDGQMVGNGDDDCYRTYADLARKIGLTAGFYFTKKKDAGHVQLRPQGGAGAIYGWPHIDEVMRSRFGDKPTLAGS